MTVVPFTVKLPVTVRLPAAVALAPARVKTVAVEDLISFPVTLRSPRISTSPEDWSVMFPPADPDIWLPVTFSLPEVSTTSSVRRSVPTVSLSIVEPFVKVTLPPFTVRSPATATSPVVTVRVRAVAPSEA